MLGGGGGRGEEGNEFVWELVIMCVENLSHSHITLYNMMDDW